MFSFDNKPIIQDCGPFIYQDEITLTVRRLDLTDPVTGGNKWFKLKLNLDQFRKGGYSELITFGGAYSNHIAAVARTGKLEGIPTTGIIRGEPESANNVTLSRAAGDGMRLIFVSRSDYRKKTDPSFLKKILPDNNNYYLLPEGGSNKEGVEGCTGILRDSDIMYSHIAVACGTGATAAGLILSLQKHQHLTGFSVLRDQGSTESFISGHLNAFDNGKTNENWHIEHDFHFGGYGKTTAELLDFCRKFNQKTGIHVEPVYTGKVFYGLEQLIGSGRFIPGSKILAIHTGGLQYLLPA